jgi:hypothetical protein
MAKTAIGKSAGPSRVRFIMVEAEIADGDIGQITQAIQNALRGPSPGIQRVVQPTGPQLISQEASKPDAEVEIEDEDETTVETAPRSVKPKTARKPAATPNVVEIDLSSDPSLASYAQKANPKSDRKRYLVILAWLKEHRGINAITADHIYTCYRSLKWPTAINDFGQPLRNLKVDQLVTSPEKGSYTINHLGIAEVEKMLAGGE